MCMVFYSCEVDLKSTSGKFCFDVFVITCRTITKADTFMLPFVSEMFR